MQKNLFKTLVLAASLLFTLPTLAVDLGQIEKDLKGDGCVGWIHGAVADQNLYVFTYRNPTNFFDYIEMSLVASDPTLLKQLSTLDRHDKVKVKGVFLFNPSPQKHIKLASIDMVEKYQSAFPTDHYSHEVKLPDDLIHQTSGTFLVHAIAGDGKVLVVEYKDSIVPIFVKNGALAKDLYRGDIVKLKFKVHAPDPNRPGEPLHLQLLETDPAPIEIVESIKAIHGKPASVEGALIMFPKSPEIMFNVFAVEQLLDAGLKRQYTIVNFDDPNVFTEMRLALQKVWDKHGADFVNGRNKLVSNSIRVKVTGTFNEQDPSQANTQILIKSVNDVQIIESVKP